jgi:hypothetical protein
VAVGLITSTHQTLGHPPPSTTGKRFIRLLGLSFYRAYIAWVSLRELDPATIWTQVFHHLLDWHVDSLLNWKTRRHSHWPFSIDDQFSRFGSSSSLCKWGSRSVYIGWGLDHTISCRVLLCISKKNGRRCFCISQSSYACLFGRKTEFDMFHQWRVIWCCSDLRTSIPEEDFLKLIIMMSRMDNDQMDLESRCASLSQISWL